MLSDAGLRGLVFVSDAADIDRVRREFLDVLSAEEARRRSSGRTIDANRNPQTLGAYHRKATLRLGAAPQKLSTISPVQIPEDQHG
jgi:hypothetical protein